jgi:hypothetical protein
LGVFAISPVARKPAPPAQKPAAPVAQPQTAPQRSPSVPSEPPASSAPVPSPQGEPPPKPPEPDQLPASKPLASQPPTQPASTQPVRAEPAPATETKEVPVAVFEVKNSPPEPAEPTISLALAPIFRLLPTSVARYAPMPDAITRIAVPMRLIEPQLASGHVEIPLDDFIAALPDSIRVFLMRVPGVKVWIPLDEIFQNLPENQKYPVGSKLSATDPSPPKSPEKRDLGQQTDQQRVTEPPVDAEPPPETPKDRAEPSAAPVPPASAAASLKEKNEDAQQSQAIPWGAVIRPINIPPPPLINGNQAGGQTAKG